MSKDSFTRQLDQVEAPESVKKALKNQQGVKRRIDPKTEAMLQAMMHRIEKIEETDGEKLKDFRRRGSGITANQIINKALEIMVTSTHVLFDEERTEEELTDAEVASHKLMDEGKESEFIKEHQIAMLDVASEEIKED
ncbi:MAG: hypothetical protein SVV03_02495 [Candidatus Nanohaloarchaea archaeon]|nr:hypothetical protein [Candidatus Nanohaloarchaea archaeon]